MKDNTSQDKNKRGDQLSTKALQEIARPYAKTSLERLIEIVQLPDAEKNASNIIGASKVLLSKVLPDLKSSEIDLGEQARLLVNILTGNGHTTNTRPNPTDASPIGGDAEQTGKV